MSSASTSQQWQRNLKRTGERRINSHYLPLVRKIRRQLYWHMLHKILLLHGQPLETGILFWTVFFCPGKKAHTFSLTLIREPDSFLWQKRDVFNKVNLALRTLPYCLSVHRTSLCYDGMLIVSVRKIKISHTLLAMIDTCLSSGVWLLELCVTREGNLKEKHDWWIYVCMWRVICLLGWKDRSRSILDQSELIRTDSVSIRIDSGAIWIDFVSIQNRSGSI